MIFAVCSPGGFSVQTTILVSETILMKLPNWFRVAWWLLLLSALTCLLWLRHSALLGGTGTAFDTIAFVIWVCLMLAPIFAEIKIFGFEFKQKIEELKQHFDRQITTLRSDIQANVELRTQINPQFHIMQPPPDSQLPKLGEQIKFVLGHTYETIPHGTIFAAKPKQDEQIDPDVEYLFRVRRALEIELRRICLARVGDEDRCKRYAGHQLVSSLRKLDVVGDDLADAVRKVYSVCSPAIHGERATPEQVRFVREVSPELLSTLRGLE
jgi:hypothetical protein